MMLNNSTIISRTENLAALLKLNVIWVKAMPDNIKLIYSFKTVSRSYKVIDMIKIKAPIALSILIAGSWIGLSGCQSDSVLDVDLCQPYDGLTPLCGYQSPEDLALLPDSSGLLVSEFGQMGETGPVIDIIDCGP